MPLTQEQATVFSQLALKLSALHINASFESAEAGPIVTTYYMRLGADVPIAKIMRAEEDLALAVGAPSVLITRKGASIAIAIPNKEKSIVSFDKCLHNLLAWSDKDKWRLPIILGENTKGIPSYIELTESPHILIAGSTGAGKSVLLASIIS